MASTFLIYFIGMDGSGKTTQAKVLLEEIAAYGIKTKYTWNRFEPFISYPAISLARKLFIKKRDPYEDYHSYVKNKKNLFKNGLLSRLYVSMLLFDYFLQITFKISIPLKLGFNIICDRYFYDTIVDLTIDSGYPLEKIERIFSYYLNILPKPNLTFFIDIPEDIAFSRKDDIPSLDYLRVRRDKYNEIVNSLLSPHGKVVLVDGCKTIDELEKYILDITFRELVNCDKGFNDRNRCTR